MSREHKVLQIVLVLLTLFSSTYNSHGTLTLERSATLNNKGYAILTNTTKHSYGQAFMPDSFPIKNSYFSINFLFGIVPEHKHQGSHGMACVISPTRGIPGASPDHNLGLFNETNNGKNSNQVIAIELDIHKDEEFGDIDDNHVGININGLTSVKSSSAGYYDDENEKFHNLSLSSGKVMRVSNAYSQSDQQLNVTVFPAEMPLPPEKPLLSLNRDISPYFLEEMYLGFTASTGDVGSLYYMLQVNIDEGVFPRVFHLNVVPTLPPYPKKASHRIRTILVVCLTVSVIAACVASWIGFVYYLRHKKVKEVLEEWEIQYGPHKFVYKELFNATKGYKEKQLLGKGGLGQVNKGTLPGSGAEIAVKRTSHDSSQGMSEFLAEISTIGRLRHPNLVRLLGYCRHKENLYLVYDCMPNGSLEKYITSSVVNENHGRLTWEQGFKIIKDVASALLQLHQE